MAVGRCVREQDVRADERITARCDKFDDCVHAVSFEGAVLYTREQNGYDDSDFYAGVYDAEANEVREVMYATTRGWTYHNGAGVDADEATVEAALAAREPLIREVVRESLEEEARRVTRGTRVEFARAFNGKKQARVAKGATGTVFWTGECRFNGGGRVGVALDDSDERVFVATHVVKAAGEVEIDEEEFEAAVARGLANTRYRYTAMKRVAA
jgi:hypothetical protein